MFSNKTVKPQRLFLSTPRRYMEGVHVNRHSFLTSTLDGRQWSNSSPRDRPMFRVRGGFLQPVQIVCIRRTWHPPPYTLSQRICSVLLLSAELSRYQVTLSTQFNQNRTGISEMKLPPHLALSRTVHIGRLLSLMVNHSSRRARNFYWVTPGNIPIFYWPLEPPKKGSFRVQALARYFLHGAESFLRS
jgi:hypothetical protein